MYVVTAGDRVVSLTCWLETSLRVHGCDYVSKCDGNQTYKGMHGATVADKMYTVVDRQPSESGA